MATKELFNQPLSATISASERIALGIPGATGAKNVTFATLKSLLPTGNVIENFASYSVFAAADTPISLVIPDVLTASCLPKIYVNGIKVTQSNVTRVNDSEVSFTYPIEILEEYEIEMYYFYI